MKQNRAVNVLTVILAVILSIVLVVAAVCTVLSSTMTAMVKPENMTKAIQSIDYTEIITEDQTLTSALEESNIDKEIVQKIMESSAATEVINTYAESLSAAIVGSEEAEGLTADKVKSIMNENMDEIVAIISENTTEELDEEELRLTLTETVNENAQEIVDILPSPKEIMDGVDPESAAVIEKVFNPSVSLALGAISLVVAGLVYACRFRKFGGLLWVGIDSAVAGTIVGAVLMVIAFGKSFLSELISAGGSVVDWGFSLVTDGLVLGMIILFVIAVVFITGGILLRNMCCKKQ